MDLRFNETLRIEIGASNGLINGLTIKSESNHLESLTPRVFTGLEMLGKLSLFKNNIGEIEDCTFLNMTELTELSLHENDLKNLTSKMLKGLKFINVEPNLHN